MKSTDNRQRAAKHRAREEEEQEGNMEVKIGNQAIIIKNVWVCDGLFCNLLSV